MESLDFTGLLALEPSGAGEFVGRCIDTPGGRLYGGQVLAQGLRAAHRTVEPRFQPHSVHAYYLRAGVDTEPISYSVIQVRDGRSFCVRAVSARQSGREVATLVASFQAPEAGPDRQAVALPEVPPPSSLKRGGWNQFFDTRYTPPGPDPLRVLAWLRLNEPLPADPILHACALAYMSDDLPGDPVRGLMLPQHGPAQEWDMEDRSLWHVSLDHAIWFHRAAKADGWHLEDFAAESTASARGLAIGRFFDEDGLHVATVGQEILLRVNQ